MTLVYETADPQDLYHSFREAGDDPDHASLAVAHRLGANPARVKAQRDREQWELAFRASRSSSMLLSDPLRADLELEGLLRRKAEIVQQMETAHDLATMPTPRFPEPSWSKYVQDASESLQRGMREYRKLALDLDHVNELIHEQQQRMARDHAVNSSRVDWRERHALIRDELIQTYKGRGAQYDLLIDELSRHKLAIEQMRAAPVPLDMAEYNKLAITILGHVNQLQKFTEASKTESIRTEVNEAIEGTLKVVESYIAPSYPNLWLEIVTEVVRRMGGQVIEQDGGYVAVPPPTPNGSSHA